MLCENYKLLNITTKICSNSRKIIKTPRNVIISIKTFVAHGYTAVKYIFSIFHFTCYKTSPVRPWALCFPSDLANSVSFNPKIHYIPLHCIILFINLFLCGLILRMVFYLHISCRPNVHINIIQT